MWEKIKKIYNKILINMKEMFEKFLKSIWIKRKIKEIDCEEIFIDFYKSDVSGSKMILDELWELVKKVLKTWLMQEFNWNSYSLEIYPEKVVIINNYNNKIGKCDLDHFVEKIKKAK